MRRPPHLRWVLGLLTPLLCIELVLRLLSPTIPSPEPWPSVGLEVKADYAERLVDDGVDLLVVGSSVSEAGIDPEILMASYGISAFNAAGPFSTPVGMQRWLEHSLWPLEPDVMIIGLSIWGAPGSGADDVLANGLDAVTAQEAVADNWLLGRSEFWTRRGQLRNLIDLVNDSVNAVSYTERGRITVYEGQTAAGGEDLADNDFSDGAAFPGFSADNRDALGEIVADAHQRGIRVVLLLEPGGCPDLLPHCANAASAERALDALHGMALQFDVEVIDGRELDTPQDWYADSAHFNEIGAAAFTDFIAEALDMKAG